MCNLYVRAKLSSQHDFFIPNFPVMGDRVRIINPVLCLDPHIWLYLTQRKPVRAYIVIFQ